MKQRHFISAFWLAFAWLLLPGFSAGRGNEKADSLVHALGSPLPDSSRIEVLLQLAAIHQADSPAAAYYYASEALFHAQRLGWTQSIAAAEYRTAVAYVDVWELREAIRHLDNSISAAQATGDKQLERNCRQYLVHCYDHLGDHSKALACQAHLLKMIFQTADTPAICRQMSAYATCLFDAGQRAEGVRVLNEAVVLAQNNLHGESRNDISAELLNTLSLLYIKLQKSDSALLCLNKALPLATAIRDTPNITYLFSSYCDAYFAAGRFDSAIYYAERTIALGESFNDLPLLKSYQDILASIYEKTGQPGRALQCYKTADSLSALIADAEKIQERSLQLSRVAIQQQQAHRLQEKRELESVNANQKKVLALVVGILLILAILSALIYRNLRTKEKASRIIEAQARGLKEQNELIDAALREKEVLLQEMHHRVKNNLQLVNSLLELQISGLEDKTSIDALTVAQQRIYSLAMVHGKLYNSSADGTVELHGFASDLFQSLSGAFSATGKLVHFQNELPEIHLSLATLVPLGLILNELITNSFKHAFAGNPEMEATIRIALTKVPASFVLSYSDSGRGIDADKFGERGGTLGLYLISRLIRQLRGEMTYNNENGSTFTFTFPYEAN